MRNLKIIMILVIFSIVGMGSAFAGVIPEVDEDFARFMSGYYLNYIDKQVVVDGFFINPVDGVVYQYVGEDVDVVVPSKLGDYEVKGIANVTNWQTQPTGGLVLSEGIEKIVDSAFYGSDLDLELILPSTMKFIGNLAFEEARGMKVVLNKGLQSVGTGAFCFSGLVDQVFPESLVEVGYGAFLGTPLAGIGYDRDTSDFPKGLEYKFIVVDSF